MFSFFQDFVELICKVSSLQGDHVKVLNMCRGFKSASKMLLFSLNSPDFSSFYNTFFLERVQHILMKMGEKVGSTLQNGGVYQVNKP